MRQARQGPAWPGGVGRASIGKAGMEGSVSERTDSLADELLALKNDSGKIVPSEVVQWARKHKRSRLYAELDWDDSSAAEKHRVWQVRSLIAVHITEPEGPRRFISLSIDRRDGGYRPLSDVMARQDLRAVMLQDALDELERVQKRYDRLVELEPIRTATAAVRRRTTPQDQAAD